MPRRDGSAERREHLTPLLAEVFAEFGYRRTTTAELAHHCGVQETTLYRLWPDKKKMFLAAIGYVFKLSERTWGELISQVDSSETTAERVLDYEAKHQCEFGLYRIVFAGLSESDDPEMRAALQEMYKSFHKFVRLQIVAHQKATGGIPGAQADLLAWALLGLGNVSNVCRELGLLSTQRRKRLFQEVGQLLLDGRVP